jgi:poly(A) polymerase
MKGKLPWSALFAKHDFFLRYKYYLAITAASKSPETQVKWYALSFHS